MARWLADCPDQAINIAWICDLDVWVGPLPIHTFSPGYMKRENVEMALLNNE